MHLEGWMILRANSVLIRHPHALDGDIYFTQELTGHARPGLSHWNDVTVLGEALKNPVWLFKTGLPVGAVSALSACIPLPSTVARLLCPPRRSWGWHLSGHQSPPKARPAHQELSAALVWASVAFWNLYSSASESWFSWFSSSLTGGEYSSPFFSWL